VAAYLDTTGSDNGLAQVIRVGYSAATGGTIADGKAVIVNANGTVSSVGEAAASVGSFSVFEEGTTQELDSTFDSSNNKIVCAYQDNGNSNHGTAVVGTVSGTSISFGTPAVFKSNPASDISCTFDSSNNKVVIMFRDSNDNNYGKAVVGTVSGTSISFGSEVTFESATMTNGGIGFDTTNNKVVIAYRDGGNSNYGTAVIGTVSGTSISFGTPVVYHSSSSQFNRVVHDSSTGKTLIAFRDGGDSNKGKCYVGTVSGTSISFGSVVVYANAGTSSIDTAFDSINNKVVISFEDTGNSDYGTSIVGTISGTSISFGTEVVFAAENVNETAICYDTNLQKVVIAYKLESNVGKVISGTVSGTSINFDSAIVFEDASTSFTQISYDSSNNKPVISFADGGNSNKGTSTVVTPLQSTLTTENFVGFMKGAALDGTNGEIFSSCSIARNQTSLTPGQTYFVSPTDGALSLTAGSPSVTAGTAISNTELIVKG
ncbi:MAG TPA: hypothetical protein DCM40_44975, partial [Maribacter sp.]|nr:hypothetical protein [Maribacter sp.]